MLGPFKKYYSNFSEQDDLISIGTIGLIKAVNTLDGSKGIRLSSYTAGCIENEVLMYFRFSQKSSQDISINEPIDTDKDGNALMLMDIMATEDNILESIDCKSKSEQLKHYIEEVPSPRERTIIRLHYGLDGLKPPHAAESRPKTRHLALLCLPHRKEIARRAEQVFWTVTGGHLKLQFTLCMFFIFY